MIMLMTENYTKDVVEVHMQSFKDFFLTFLGKKFLRLYYNGIVNYENAIKFVYIKDDRIVGFVVGTSNPQGFYSRLLKQDWLRFSVASLGAICRKPSVIRRIVRAFSHPSENPIGDDVAGLFSIGVLPELQGTGVGKSLVQMFLEEAKKRCCKKVFLTTDSENNDAVNAFYQKLGFKIEREYITPEGRRMNEYWIELR